MKKNLALLLSTIMFLNPIPNSFADTGERVIEAKGFNYEYSDNMFKASHILRVTEGRLISTSVEMPATTEDAHELFEEVCAPKSSNQDLNRKLTITYQGLYKTSSFECERRSVENENISTVQFVFTTDRDDHLKDLQINELKAARAVKLDPHKLTAKDAAEVGIAVAASTLVSGLLARQIYAGEQDKFLHATGGALIGAAVTLLSYYGFKVTKNQAALIGFATTVAIALLKEYAYDANHRDAHTVDINDADATMMGGAVGTIFIRLKFEW